MKSPIFSGNVIVSAILSPSRAFCLMAVDRIDIALVLKLGATLIAVS